MKIKDVLTVGVMVTMLLASGVGDCNADTSAINEVNKTSEVVASYKFPEETVCEYKSEHNVEEPLEDDGELYHGDCWNRGYEYGRIMAEVGVENFEGSDDEYSAEYLLCEEQCSDWIWGFERGYEETMESLAPSPIEVVETGDFEDVEVIEEEAIEEDETIEEDEVEEEEEEVE